MALLDRLRSLAPNPTNAVAAIKLSLRSYRASESAPRDLISTLWNILDRDLDNTASIINLILDVVDDDEKKSALLSAWNGFKVEVRSPHPLLSPFPYPYSQSITPLSNERNSNAVNSPTSSPPP